MNPKKWNRLYILVCKFISEEIQTEDAELYPGFPPHSELATQMTTAAAQVFDATVAATEHTIENVDIDGG